MLWFSNNGLLLFNNYLLKEFSGLFKGCNRIRKGRKAKRVATWVAVRVIVLWNFISAVNRRLIGR